MSERSIDVTSSFRSGNQASFFAFHDVLEALFEVKIITQEPIVRTRLFDLRRFVEQIVLTPNHSLGFSAFWDGAREYLRTGATGKLVTLAGAVYLPLSNFPELFTPSHTLPLNSVCAKQEVGPVVTPVVTPVAAVKPPEPETEGFADIVDMQLTDNTVTLQFVCSADAAKFLRRILDAKVNECENDDE
jgi:hypothetical protein